MNRPRLASAIRKHTRNVLKEYMDSHLSRTVKNFRNSRDDWGDKWNSTPYGDDQTQIVKNQWMIHFADIQHTHGIAKQGFALGNRTKDTPSNITYKRIKYPKSDGQNDTYNYAYLATDVIETMKDKFDDTFMYHLSQERQDGFVMFKANGYRFFHIGDSENQVIFNSVQKDTIVEVQYIHEHYCVIDKSGLSNNTNPSFQKDEGGNRISQHNINPKNKYNGILYHSRNIENVIKWVVTNYEQYRRKIGN